MCCWSVVKSNWANNIHRFKVLKISQELHINIILFNSSYRYIVDHVIFLISYVSPLIYVINSDMKFLVQLPHNNLVSSNNIIIYTLIILTGAVVW